ncbi:hypothetical protein AGMMS50268_01840 [Spirochaetia bacterium]|nr:hypothetical protein AGMMS50268_01840 [Spirochaetia bacterium]
MKEYKSANFKYLHEEIKNLVQAGDMSAADLKEFEQDCFKPAAGTPHGRAARTPAIAASARDRSAK